MARNEENRLRESRGSYQEALDRQVDAVMREAERKKRLKEFDRQVNTLAERAIVFEDRYGVDDYRTQLMTMFLEVTLQMKSVIDLLNDVGVALQCIGQAIGCVDDILNLQQEILEGSLGQKYGFWERLRRKRRLRRAIRNNVARMTQMADMLIGSQKMAMSIVTSLQKSCVKMKAMSEKSFAKQNKRNGGASASSNEGSLAKKLMDEMRASRGDGATDASVNTDNGSNGGTNGGSVNASEDDLSDIL